MDTGRFLQVESPATLEKLGQVPIMGEEEVAFLAKRAREAFKSWRGLNVSQRAKCVRRAIDGFIDEKERILDTICLETGKTRTEALYELFGVIDILTFYRKRAKSFLRDENRTPHGPMRFLKRAFVRYFPRGVVGVVSPWNYPFLLPLCDAGPALIAGNCVILKPSEYTPLTALLIQDIFRRAELPEGVYQTATGNGKTGEHVVRHADMAAFTGSHSTGLKIAEVCARVLKPYSLELGGKDPAIVLEGGNLKRIAKGIVWGSLFNAGQTCVSIERVYATEAVYEAFVSLVLKEVQGLRVGIDDKFSMDMGSVTTPAQLQTVERHIEDALAKGAKVLAGGKRIPSLGGYFFEPTVVVDVRPGMAIMEEESFGPIIAIQKVKDGEEALATANQSTYGLSASVWGNQEKALRLSRRLESGSVCINEALTNFMVPELPFGGIKQSGYGTRHGKEGIRRFLRSQSVLLPRFRPSREVVWYPYSKSVARMIERGLAWLYHSRF
jgi:acyl-CoA reductase-like NAD-dependent aldehyde dehydrogenase